MRFFNNLLLLAIFLFFFHNLFHPVNSDANLINTLCDNNAVCKECLEADPNSKLYDGKGLALIALSCAKKDTTYLHEDIFQLFLDDRTHILGDCVSHTFMAQQKVATIADYVLQGNYDAAKHVITEEVVPLVNECLEEFNRAPELVVPQKVLAGTVVANQTCNIVAGILTHL